MPPPREWTIEEADTTLPRLHDLFRRLDEGTPALTPQVAAEALAADGIVLRDAERGLIDFAGRSSDGRPLWLCWVRGEPAVAHWHSPEDGFAGRRPVEEVP
jgi:hypothetical protein